MTGNWELVSGLNLTNYQLQKKGTGNREQGAGGRGQGAGNREQGTGNREQGAGNRGQGTGGREQGAGGREQIRNTHLHQFRASVKKKMFLQDA
jgi:hypothetical protein